tara:strand:- start:55079 stop:56068 length:990 start_codon:yes stop_codon:yes gene_type:complete
MVGTGRLFIFTLFILIGLGFYSCKPKADNTPRLKDTVTVPVKSSLFLSEGLAEPVSVVTRTLSDGTKAECYKIVVKSIPSDHNMGPWCPENITDDSSAGGIWMEGGNVYDVDGAFIKNLASFYNDNTWMMYDANTGAIIKTGTKEECADAANPNVGEEYKNFCVECMPSYVGDITHTYYIPVRPKVAVRPYKYSRGPGGGLGRRMPSVRGLAFNGVVFDAPAPVDRILEAYTLAPFDDAGGHINLAAGYHYHAATGLSTKIYQSDTHAAMIGYAMDGYGIYENKDAEGNSYHDLDASRGHYDSSRGYHYHVDKAGSNNFIDGLRGEFAE